MKKIVISNIYGKFNLGDYAIRNSALKIVDETLPKSDITLLCEDIEDFKLNRDISGKLTELYAPYGYVIKSTSNIAVPRLLKFLRLLNLFIGTAIFVLLGSISTNLLPQKHFFSFITRIKESDVFFLMGGGYLVTRNHKDILGLILNIIPLFVAKAFNKKIIILPISYGPYYNTFHTNLAGWAIQDTNVICRDKISLENALKCNKEAIFLPDLALYDWPSKPIKPRKNYFVLTIKDYLSKEKQLEVEAQFLKFIKKLWSESKTKCIFIPTGANPIEENDVPVGERLKESAPKGSVEILIPEDPEKTKAIFEDARFAICTRLHSAIFSSIAYTPFISIAYEYKVTGFMEFMELEKWNVPMTDVNYEHLVSLYEELNNKKNYQNYLEKLEEKRKEIKSNLKNLKEFIIKHS